MIEVINVLENDAPVLARVGTNIYPMERQQKDGLPAITVEVTDIEANATKSGVSDLDEEYVSVTGFASTYAEARLLAAEVRTALDRYDGTNQGVVIQKCFYINEYQNKVNVNNVRIYFIEQNYKLRIER